jgi:MFS family permease
MEPAPTPSLSPASASTPKSDIRGLKLLLRAFRNRNYRLFFGGQVVSLIGTFLTQVATIWLVYRLSGKSALMLGVVGFAGQIPMFLLAPFAGVWVDRWNRRRLLVITQCCAMLQSFALAALCFSPWLSVGGIIILSIVQGLINAFDVPGRQAFLVEMVDSRDDLANAIALNSTMVHAARLIGPAAAGVLIAYIGEKWCFFIDGCSYVGVIVAFLAMHVQPTPLRKQATSVLHDLKEGFHYVTGSVPIRSLLLVMALISLTGMPAFSVLMPIFGDALSHTVYLPFHHALSPADAGAQTLGFLMGASGIGAFCGALFLASRRTVVGLGRVIAFAVGTFGLAILAFALSRHFWISVPIVMVAGAGMITTFASCNTLLQTLAEDDKRGRVMSFFTMAFVGMTPWGNLAAGAAAARFGGGILGASHTLLIAGGFVLLIAARFAIKLPSLRKLVRPIYVQKGILPAVATGLRNAAEVTDV